jgi:hypothetical protein
MLWIIGKLLAALDRRNARADARDEMRDRADMEAWMNNALDLIGR